MVNHRGSTCLVLPGSYVDGGELSNDSLHLYHHSFNPLMPTVVIWVQL